MSTAIFDEISLNLQQGRAKNVKDLVQQAVDTGHNVKDILEKGLLAGMDIIGTKFKNNEVYVPEVLIAARAMKAGTDTLKPYMASSGVVSAGKVIVGTVKGDLHDIGKNLVKMMLEGKGLEVIDLGVDVSKEKFVEAVKENDAGVIACSALLTTTMSEMKGVVEALVTEGLRDKVKIMVGGAPVTETFKNNIGADFYAPDAASAAEEAVKYYKTAAV